MYFSAAPAAHAFPAAQAQSKAEDEAIAKLEFAAHQKLSALEQDQAQQATLNKMRDEASSGAGRSSARLLSHLLPPVLSCAAQAPVATAWGASIRV